MRPLRDHGLGLAFGALFVAALIGQAFVGHADFNASQLAHDSDPVSFWQYVSSADFGVDVFENWQSEYLQFSLLIFGTVWLVQRGSTESKPLGEEGRESDAQQRVGAFARPDSPAWARAGGWRRTLYSNSLLLVMTSIWLGSWIGQAITGRIAYNAEQAEHGEAAVGFWRYLTEPDFWDRTLQNWQSEFLAVASMVVFSIFLRQRGSPESKPVGASHGATGVEG